MSLLSADPAKASVAKPIDALLEFLGEATGALLDIGCGEGELSDTLAQHGYAVTGIDPLVGRGSRAWRVQASAGAIPLASGVFDIAVFHWSLHHVPEHLMASALTEARRVLKENGRLFVIEPEPVGNWQQVSHTFHDETEVQEKAAQVVEELVQSRSPQRRRQYYLNEDCYESFDGFVDAMMSFSYHRYCEGDIRQDTVRESFESCREDNAYCLRHRVRMEEICWN
ncbi:MAG: methyltransferase domain-containing protein [Arenicellales bacterium]|jgi:ubiquinone/menaquinone biosynthesis C-methylase UbiE|nr:methyltransferase domain-containing protein [Arenicellales bacterium]MDP6551756.1 methyltransferase domain-containing protein [Arenicellales bacterium]MDP6918091.1 methyltransferase domain-containing protein [Arenicellales bacterium]|tara:strand:+ start:43418 stop:44095 length:678 start_codon:yes stop_codon:yes gene_type:complete